MRGIAVLTAFTALLASVGAAPHNKREVSPKDLLARSAISCKPGREHYHGPQIQKSSNGVVWVSDLPRPIETSTPKPSSGEIYAEQSIITTQVTPSVPVVTVSANSGTAQIIPTVSSSAGSGSINTNLPTSAPMPLLTSSIPTPLTTIAVTAPASTQISTVIPQMKSANIFQPIATSSPPSTIESRADHPGPPVGVQSHTSPIGTNKFYGNLMVGSQSSRVWTHPYTLAWAKGSDDLKSWGMAISYDADRRVFGPTQSDIPGNPVQYFIHAAGIQSIVLSAVSLGSSTTLTTDSIKSDSINVNLLASPESAPTITFPLVQGMGFVTGIYNTGTDTPLLQSSIFFKSIDQVAASPKPGITKFRITLNDDTNWLLYAYSNSAQPITFKLVDQSNIQGTSNFNGYLQIARSTGPLAESLFDAACGVYPTGVTLSASVNGATGSYTRSFLKSGLATSTLLMFALPHHIQSFSPSMQSAVQSLQLNTTTKGAATAVFADGWNLVENLPNNMGFGPWSPSQGLQKRTYSAESIAAMSRAAISELSQDMDAQSNQVSVYGAGKALAKFAQIVYVMHDIVGDVATAQAGLTHLQAAFTRWSENRQSFPLYYESVWGGLVSSASYSGGDPGADYGNTFYNDHHFHYGYLVYAASIIGYLDPTWLTDANKDYVNTLARDYNNPSTEDNYFPVYRNFDWYHGHSWAHGVTEYADGKDEESSSEDTMSAYAIKMWGKTIGDSNMEGRGSLQLAITARSLQNYFLYTSENTVQPPNFIGNKVSGIMFENKIDHTTYFGNNPEYIQGIHMLPLLPSSTLTRTKQFVQEEWNTYFSNGRAEQVDGGWKGILFANLAIVDPVSAWNFFSAPGFDAGWLDGGASLTWYLALAAGLGGAL